MKLVNNINRTTENDVYVIRKLLEQIHSYFEYLECPYYSSELSERDLLLLLIQPSAKRYKLIEWMLNRLEPDIDFYLPRELGNGDDVSTHNPECRDSINAIAFLKNLGLCYSRVLVPDIVHAKVGPLVQLKFLVRLLRGIRLKSWNKRPVIRKKDNPNIKDGTQKASEVVSENEEGRDELGPKRELIGYVEDRIKRNHTAKTMIETFKKRFNAEQFTEFKDKIYMNVLKRLNENDQSKNVNNEYKPVQFEFNYRHVSFIEGMIKLISQEILIEPDNDDMTSSGCFTTNDCDSYCSLTIRNVLDSSRSTSRSSNDAILEKNNTANSFIPIRNMGCETPKEQVLKLVDNNNKSFSTSVNLTKHMDCFGDNFPQPKPRIHKKEERKSIQHLFNENSVK